MDGNIWMCLLPDELWSRVFSYLRPTKPHPLVDALRSAAPKLLDCLRVAEGVHLRRYVVGRLKEEQLEHRLRCMYVFGGTTPSPAFLKEIRHMYIRVHRLHYDYVHFEVGPTPFRSACILCKSGCGLQVEEAVKRYEKRTNRKLSLWWWKDECCCLSGAMDDTTVQCLSQEEGVHVFAPRVHENFPAFLAAKDF